MFQNPYITNIQKEKEMGNLMPFVKHAMLAHQ
jgi:hypothetical protein